MKLSAMMSKARQQPPPEVDHGDHIPGLDPMPVLPVMRTDGWPADETGQVTHPPEKVPASLGVYIDPEGQAWLASRVAGSDKLTLFLGPLPRFHNHVPF